VADLLPPSDSEESLIEFPCYFPIKVMGKNVEGFAQTISNLLVEMSPKFNPSSMEMRPSKAGNYLGLTCKVWVGNKAELDEIYRTLSTHPMVSVVL
jgi:uncharacterized protein